MFTIVKEYHFLLRKANLKAAPDKTMFFIRKVRFLVRNVISKDGLSPIASRIDDIRNLKTPESKTEVLRVLGMMGFYHTYILIFHIDAKPLYDLTRRYNIIQVVTRTRKGIHRPQTKILSGHFLRISF